MRTIFICAVIVAVALAGCVGGAEEPEAPGALKEDAAGADAAARNVTEEEPAEAPTPPEPVTVNVTFEGETGTFACAMAQGEPICQGSFSESAMHDLEFTGTPLVMEGTLTWDADGPWANTMEVRVLPRNGTEVDFMYEDAPRAEGRSPLEFRFDLQDLAGRELVVDVSSAQSVNAGGAMVFASMGQAFGFDARFTYQPDA